MLTTSADPRLPRRWPEVAIALFFLVLAARGTLTYFNYDDMTNLFKVWEKPLSSTLSETVVFWAAQTRPVGGMFYLALYHLAGFHPLPFRIASFALLLLNLALLYRIFTTVSNSRGTALTALLLVSFQAVMWDIYSNTGMIYDILCGTFYFAALALYVSGRRRGSLSLLRMGAIAALLILAIGSKEMALSLPLTLALYELLFRSPARFRNLLPIGVPALITAAYIAGRLAIPGPLSTHPAYAPLFTTGRFLETTTAYTRLLFNGNVELTPTAALIFWAACLAIALAARSRLMIFGLFAFLCGMLPLSFVTPRQTGAVFYVPLFGLALYLATGLDLVRSRIPPRTAQLAFTSCVIAAIATVDVIQNAHLIRDKIGPGGQGPVLVTATELPALCPRIAPRSRILMVNSPFGDERYLPMFTIALRYGVRDITVERARSLGEAPPGSFDHIFVYAAGHFTRPPR